MADFQSQAAVIAVLSSPSSETPEGAVLLTKRASYLKSHAGEVALPGGKWEHGDGSLADTAFRECWEEVGIPKSALSVKGELPVQYSRKGIKVTPFVCDLVHPVELALCDFELEASFWFPLRELLNDRRQQTDLFVQGGAEFWAPVYHYGGYKIWGLTARILVSLANHYFDVNIVRESNAPEVLFGGRVSGFTLV